MREQEMAERAERERERGRTRDTSQEGRKGEREPHREEVACSLSLSIVLVKDEGKKNREEGSNKGRQRGKATTMKNSTCPSPRIFLCHHFL